MAKPVVDGLEQELADGVIMLRINARDRENAGLAAEYGIRALPTLIVWQEGKEVARSVGRIDRETVLRAVTP